MWIWIWGLVLGLLLGAIIAFFIVLYVEGGHKKIKLEPIETDRDLSMTFAVANDNTLWLAVHQVVNEIEKECVEGARRYIANTNQCISAVGAGEGASLVRTRLIEKRNLALKELNQRAG